MSLKGVLESSHFSQVALVVNDLESTKKEWARLLGVEVPETAPYTDPMITETKFYGKDAPLANSKLAFIDLVPGVQLELIEPNQEHSVWRDEITRIGEGLHHIAFNVDDTDSVVKQLIDEYDAVVEQEGFYGDKSGKYTYLSLHKKLKCRIELLESFRGKSTEKENA
jgi:methylmalonyl-CoA/ethylmalonyl-CoA epimerase